MALINCKEERVRWLGDQHMLVPGVNEVPDKVWEAFKGLAVIKHLVESGLMVEQDAKSLASMSPEAALALIKDTFSLDLLSKWKVDEKRPKVVRALEARMTEMQKAVDLAGKKDEG